MPSRKSTTAKAHPNDYKKSAAEKRKGQQYDEATKAKALRVYLKFNGRNFAAQVRDLRKEYKWITEPTLKKWAAERFWKTALEIKIERDRKTALTSADVLSDQVETVRDYLFGQITAEGAGFDKEKITLHERYVARSVEILTKVKEARDTLGGFMAMLEKLCEYLLDISPDGLETLAQNKEEIFKRAAEDYGTGEKEIADDE